MLSKLIGGILYDPAQKVNGELHDIFIRDGFIVCDPGPDAKFDEVYDIAGKVVMAGAIDIHSHIAGGNVNTARLLLPEQHRNHMARRLNHPFSTAKWSTTHTGYRYARMGYTTVVEPAMLPVNALDVHLQMADIPILDTAALAILGNDDLLLRLMRDRASQSQINDYVAWTLHTTCALGLKVINPGLAWMISSRITALVQDKYCKPCNALPVNWESRIRCMCIAIIWAYLAMSILLWRRWKQRKAYRCIWPMFSFMPMAMKACAVFRQRQLSCWMVSAVIPILPWMSDRYYLARP